MTALDVFPTLAQWMDVDIPSEVPIDGQTLWPLLDKGEFTRQQPLYWSIPTPDGMEFAVREGDWKLILDAEGAPRYLFNLSTDWYEVNNLLDGEPAVLKRLLAAFQRHRDAVESDPLALARKSAQR